MPHVHPHDRVPVFDLHVPDRGVTHDAGVVHEDVELAELVDRLLHHLAGQVVVGHVGEVGYCHAPALGNQLDGVFGCAPAPLAALATAEVVDDDLGALLRELHGVAAADAVPGAGDDRDLAFEYSHLSHPVASWSPGTRHCIFPTLTEPIGEPAPAAALAGVRVLDLATLFPAPMVAAMLGDLGADVVKVEPTGGDPLRVTGAMRGDRTFVWALADRNKRACASTSTPPTASRSSGASPPSPTSSC